MLGVQLADDTVVSVGTLAVMGGLLHLVQREGDWAGCTKCNSQPINGWCTKFILFDVALLATDQGMPGMICHRLCVHHPRYLDNSRAD